jgi:hypothetical protein
MTAEKRPLGAWEQDRAKIEQVKPGDHGDVADLQDDVRFQTYVARHINRREQNENAEFDQPAAFILVPPEAYERLKVGRVEERLIHTGSKRLTGRIHFVTSAAISSIVEEYQGDDHELFARITAMSFAAHPTLIYVPQKPSSTLSYYPQGTATDDGVTDVRLIAPPVTASAIQSAIDAVHKQELVTPDQNKLYPLWQDAAKGRPQELAEARIQYVIRVGLTTRFIPYSIRQEQPAKVGRTDLEIIDDRTGPQGSAIHHAVLELKVLRSRGSTGNAYTDESIQAHIKDGVEQAHAYGRDKNTNLQMLCCFDMRDSDTGNSTTFARIATDANKLNVLLSRWYLYRDSNAYRAAIAAEAAAKA